MTAVKFDVYNIYLQEAAAKNTGISLSNIREFSNIVHRDSLCNDEVVLSTVLTEDSEELVCCMAEEQYEYFKTQI